jgi:polyphosphate kinase
MERNFFRRVEVAFPIRREAHRARILSDLDTYLADDTQAWELGRDGMYTKVETSKDAPVGAQSQLLAKYAAGSVIKL